MTQTQNLGKIHSGFMDRLHEFKRSRCGFCPVNATLDQLYMLSRIREVTLEFTELVYMYFVELKKVFDHVLQGGLWEVLW